MINPFEANRNKRRKQVEEFMKEDTTFVIPSGRRFFDQLEVEMRKSISMIDASNFLEMPEDERYKQLISSYINIAQRAFVETLIQTGFKRKRNPWKFWE